MLDEARMLVERRVDPAIAARCEEIHAAGGLGPPPPGAMPDVLPPSGEASRDVLMHDASVGGQQDLCALHVPSCLPSCLRSCGLPFVYIHCTSIAGSSLSESTGAPRLLWSSIHQFLH
jgi:hypothetical protein